MKTVLVLEGTGHDPQALQQLLAEHGYATSNISEGAWPREEALQLAEQFQRDIVQNAPVAIFRSSFDDKLLNVNPAGARMHKYDSPEEMIDTVNRRGVAEALYVDSGHRRAILEKALLTNDWQVYEEQFRCKDGSVTDIYLHIRAVPGADGQPVELEGFVEDVSECKQAERALHFTQFAIDKTSD